MAERQAIPTATRLRLFAASAGYCQNPDCLEALFPAELGGQKHTAEIAHVIPHGEAGPRNKDRPTDNFSPDIFENLLLLCPTCHTKVDKAEETYPRALLLEWKEGHLDRVAVKNGIRTYQSREEARIPIVAIFDQNRAIWDQFAPGQGTKFEYDPESEASQAWDQRVRSVMIPNNLRAQAIIDANLGLATDDERRAFARFREHVRGLIERHVGGVAGRAIPFPNEIGGIFS